MSTRGVRTTCGQCAARFPVAIFVYAFLGWTFDFYDLVLLGFLKDGVVRDLGMSHGTEGWLLGAGLGASGVGGLVAGALADRFGKRRVLSATVLIYSIGSLHLRPRADAAASSSLGRIVQGLGIGGEWAIGHGMLAEAVAAGVPRARGRVRCRRASRSASPSPRSSATWCCRASAGARC